MRLKKLSPWNQALAWIFTSGFSLAVISLALVSLVEKSKRRHTTLIIESCGGIAEQMYENSDLVQRLSHYTDGHSEPRIACPECSRSEYRPEQAYPAESLSDTKPDATIEDDYAEIMRSHEAFRSHLRSQAQALRHALSGLRRSK